MDAWPSTSEIVESTEELEFDSKKDEKAGKLSFPNSRNKSSIEDDINRLFKAIDIKTSGKGLDLSNESSKDSSRKKAMKRPTRVGSPKMSRIEISEPLSLKQALRGLCISQASEMAAMKRLSRLAGPSGASEARTIIKLYRAVVIESNGSGLPLNEGKGNLIEISLVPERITSSSTETMCKSLQMEKADNSYQNAPLDQVVPWHTGSSRISKTEVDRLKFLSSHATEKDVDEKTSASIKLSGKTPFPNGHRKHLHIVSLPSNWSPGCAVPAFSGPRFMRPIFRNKSFAKKKVKQDLAPVSRISNPSIGEVNNDLDPSTSNSDTCDHTTEIGREESVKAASASSGVNHSIESNSGIEESSSSKLDSSISSSKTKSILSEVEERSRSREKGDFSQSSKSSIGDKNSTSVSEDSNLSGSSRCCNRPHMSRDLRWEAIRLIQRQHGSLGLKHFKLIKKLGCGDIGSVYLAELIGTDLLFALKVMDNEFLASRKKMSRTKTECEILHMLDHPFLLTLYAHFVSDRFSCLVLEYCPGGDLQVLRQKQPCRRFSEQAARFYVAEVLLALEYLHMLGVVYLDLKLENILVREDGHIMLSDFDSSLRCSINPILVQSTSLVAEPTKKTSSLCSVASCIDPFCLHSALQVSCFTPRLLSATAKSRKLKSELAAQASTQPQLVVEPTNVRSNSFIGAHEYLAPEIVKGDSHGSAVDWWTLGILLFELLYGGTPFKGLGNEETISNVVSRSLKFPITPIISFHARNLIRSLLIKEPKNRLGSSKGAAEIRQHPFFEGLNWALICCAIPPEMPNSCDVGIGTITTFSQNKESSKDKESKSAEKCTEFEMF